MVGYLVRARVRDRVRDRVRVTVRVNGRVRVRVGVRLRDRGVMGYRAGAELLGLLGRYREIQWRYRGMQGRCRGDIGGAELLGLLGVVSKPLAQGLRHEAPK